MSDTTMKVYNALKDNGYTVAFRRARFVKMNSIGQEMHEIEYTNDLGEPEKGIVYVWQENGVWKGDF